MLLDIKMFRFLLVVFIFIFVATFVVVLSVPLSTSFDDVQASKRDARQSLQPDKPYEYYIPSPFGDYYKNNHNE